jgi:penicillin-binding protein 2
MLGGPAASAGASPHTLEIPAPKPIAGLRPRTLQVVGEGLRQVVAAESGSGHGTVFIEGLAIAGKTGTAETGGGKPPHAWFAGYVPAERPRLVLVVVLEHGGSGAVAAGPLARRLVLQMQELGMF